MKFVFIFLVIFAFSATAQTTDKEQQIGIIYHLEVKLGQVIKAARIVFLKFEEESSMISLGPNRKYAVQFSISKILGKMSAPKKVDQKTTIVLNVKLFENINNEKPKLLKQKEFITKDLKQNDLVLKSAPIGTLKSLHVTYQGQQNSEGELINPPKTE